MVDIIMKFIDGLNSNSGAITACATVVLVFITAVYAGITWKMRIDAQTPEIIIYPVVSSKLVACVDLYVQNIGPGTAYDVKFPSDLSFSLGSNPPLEEALFLQHGIGCLLPGESRHYNLNNSPRIDLNDIVPIELKIVTTYNDSRGKKHTKCFCIRFREYID